MRLSPFTGQSPTKSEPKAKTQDRSCSTFRYEANEEIYAQGEEVHRLYRLLEGVVRTNRFNSDGRRQVGDFYYPGDVFGLEMGDEHQYSAEALTDCRVESISSNPGGGDHNVALAEITRQELRKASEHVMLLGRKTAREKVALFLMAYATRNRGVDVDLPMGRQDIADYLGLTVETVSRMLTQLQGESVIAFPGVRRFQVKRWDVLEELAA